MKNIFVFLLLCIFVFGTYVNYSYAETIAYNLDYVNNKVDDKLNLIYKKYGKKKLENKILKLYNKNPTKIKNIYKKYNSEINEIRKKGINKNNFKIVLKKVLINKLLEDLLGNKIKNDFIDDKPKISIYKLEREKGLDRIEVPQKIEEKQEYSIRDLTFLRKNKKEIIFKINKSYFRKNQKGKEYHIENSKNFSKDLLGIIKGDKILLIKNKRKELVKILKYTEFYDVLLSLKDLKKIINKNYLNYIRVYGISAGIVGYKNKKELIKLLEIMVKHQENNKKDYPNKFSYYDLDEGAKKIKKEDFNKIKISYYKLNDGKIFINEIFIPYMYSNTDNRIYNAYKFESMTTDNKDFQKKLYLKYKQEYPYIFFK